MIGSTEKEYELLRDEISEWQNRRFTLVGVSITVVTALLGFSQIAGIKVTWDFISSLLLFFLSVACWLTAYCGIANVKIGTYLQAFHEGHESSFHWESRNSRFSKVGRKYGNLNQYLGAVYLILAILSLLAPPLMFKPTQSSLFPVLLVALMIGAFIASLVWLYKSQGRREEFLKRWLEVKKQESQNESAA